MLAGVTFSPDGINFRERWKHDNLYTVKNFASSTYRMYDEVTDPKNEEFANELGTATSCILVKDDFMINVHEVRPSREGIVFREGGYPLGFDKDLVCQGGQSQDAPRGPVVLHFPAKKVSALGNYLIISF